MGLKQVSLNPEDSKEFIELLQTDAGPEVIEAFLDNKNPTDVPEALVKTMQLIADLEKLQEEEKTILSKIFAVREQMMNDLTIELLATEQAEQEIPTVLGGPTVDETSPPAAETSPISTDQKTPS